MPKKPSAATEAQLDAQLAVAVKRAASLVTTGGARRLTPQDPLRVFYVTHTTSNNASAGPSAAGSPSPDMVSFPLTSSSASTSSVQQLVDAAAPSPFGKRKRTVHDPAVRTAMEIKAAQLALNKTLPPQEVRGRAGLPGRGLGRDFVFVCTPCLSAALICCQIGYLIVAVTAVLLTLFHAANYAGA